MSVSKDALQVSVCLHGHPAEQKLKFQFNLVEVITAS